MFPTVELLVLQQQPARLGLQPEAVAAEDQTGGDTKSQQQIQASSCSLILHHSFKASGAPVSTRLGSIFSLSN